ncbi:MAG: hypothetical protein CVU17_01480 [Betaproteobacteria bacterium HGW-Betaproteobacteria-11]|jgi:hypothetical protein|nr:MAG: hypothetical protein CVU17_01480 [Betaproteobacteria bacterium HGW-Betaproteobacteria-11]
MKFHHPTAWLACGLALLAAPAWTLAETGITVAGVHFQMTTKIDSPSTENTATLTLNGAGLRGVLFIKAYAMGLYLPRRTTTTADILALLGPKRIHIVALRDLSAEQFADALVKGIHKNHGEAELAILNPRLEGFRATLLAQGEAVKGTVILLDWLPDGTDGITRLTVNGKHVGNPVPGEDFYQALLRIWLGERPAEGGLKRDLLGAAD